MKTFEELKKQRLEKEEKIIALSREKLKNEPISEDQKSLINFKMQDAMKAVENIDEVVKMQIAYNVNSLFNGLEWYLLHGVTACISNPEKNGELLKNEHFLRLQQSISYFGITFKELKDLISGIFSGRTRDALVIFINDRFDTNIPLAAELIDAGQKATEVYLKDSSEKNLAYKKYHILRLTNGDYLENGEYPLYYQSDILAQYSNDGPLNQSVPKQVK